MIITQHKVNAFCNKAGLEKELLTKLAQPLALKIEITKAHSTLKNSKNVGKRRTKALSRVFSSQKLKFSANLAKKNAMGEIFIVFCEKWLKIYCFSRKIKIREKCKP